MKKAGGLSQAVDSCLIVIDVSENLSQVFDYELQTVRNSAGDGKSVWVY